MYIVESLKLRHMISTFKELLVVLLNPRFNSPRPPSEIFSDGINYFYVPFVNWNNPS